MNVLLRVPHYSQFDAEHVKGAGPTACYRACRAMAASVGVTVPESTVNRIQVATKELEDGVEIDKEGAASGTAYVLAELAKGRPVVIGVHYKMGSQNRDGITDHFMLVVGVDDEVAPMHFLANDPGRTGGTDGYPNAVIEAQPDGSFLRVVPRYPRMWLSMVVRSAN